MCGCIAFVMDHGETGKMTPPALRRDQWLSYIARPISILLSNVYPFKFIWANSGTCACHVDQAFLRHTQVRVAHFLLTEPHRPILCNSVFRKSHDQISARRSAILTEFPPFLHSNDRVAYLKLGHGHILPRPFEFLVNRRHPAVRLSAVLVLPCWIQL
jgi:hypothetical protein